MTAHLGAHEVMEIHEVLTDSINVLNNFELYRPHVRDQQLGTMLDRHVQFMTQEYNACVQALGQGGAGQAVPFRAPKAARPVYGLDNPVTQSPNTSVNRMDDRDIASGMLCAHKAAAVFKMMATLECADPTLRRMLQQGAVNCAELAYDVWQFMNHRGYYQVPTMKEMTTNTVLNSYGQAQMGPAGRNQYGQGQAISTPPATMGIYGNMGAETGSLGPQNQSFGTVNNPGRADQLFS